jgi:O-antigen ligase
MKPATMVLSAICGVLLIGVGTMMWQKVVTAGGKDLTFSGRTVIWESAIPAIKARPWIGYGLGGVFTNLAVEPSRSIITHIGFPIGHAHSSYFQLLLEMGIIGLGLWLMISITTIVTSARLLGYNPAIAQFGILYCLTMLVTSFSETLSGGGWVAVLIIIRALVSREFKHERFSVVGGTPRRRFEAAPASTPNGPPPHLVGVAQ